MNKLYLTKTIPNKDKKIELTYEFPSTSPGSHLEGMENIVKKFNEAVTTFEKKEMPADSKPDENFVHYNRTCKYCNTKNSVMVVTYHYGGSGKASEQTQEEKLRCSECKRSWPLTARASSAPTHDEKLIHSIRVIFKNARDKLYDDNLANKYIHLIPSEIETRIIQRILYG